MVSQEIEAAVPEATKKDIGKAFKTIVAILQAEDGVSLPLLSTASLLECSFSLPCISLLHQADTIYKLVLGNFVDGRVGPGRAWVQA